MSVGRRLAPWVLLGVALGACSPRPESGTVRAARPGDEAARPEPAGRAEAEQVRAELTELRARRGRSPAMPFPVVDVYLADAKRRIEKGRDPMRAVDDSLQSAADEGDRDIRFWALVADDLRAVKFPSALLSTRELHAGIAVAHRGPRDGNARDQYVVLIAISVEYLKQTGAMQEQEP